ncbi:branched-chain amino acid transport system ATP-binding protein [Rhizobium tibeticum]|uniref:Amino acid/amide ABC transporter ATP-binding protein 1, HAAT family n=1 Tax=Rhizobium tibeticum TaxID=501024 RepID=A0A1H8J2P9_9HYPH|nr:ABC transporter ATP-binding protein [Rhizobium tibeticum]MDP9812056.1 branched-chain amino acid transport system ATP-binding protein [Rhizobium tibeticum]SEH74193.1 Lipopolysaccharide export system ATP-binding protein LptB [Rhizobium tibeticum]SEN74899.1 amino acid/amide ABC transporter ATP-binding protein 1, HAAT family [Rhizobium tibeticum]
MPILELEGVSKTFGALTVAEQISFAVEDGEALGIIGPNGAGKSTVFNLINGNISVDSGAIRFRGSDVTNTTPMARCFAGMGRTFQIPQPFDQLTVFENLLVAGSFGARKREGEVADRCAEILIDTGLIDKANAMAGSLTLLQRKRLELARAMATDPKLLLLDEIAGGLTEGECRALVATIRGLHSKGIAVIWIEHVLHALNAVVGRLLVLHFGRVIGIGKPDEIMNSKQVREIYLGIDV